MQSWPFTTTQHSSGYYSDPFCIYNGTRQGCPMSPLLFALCIEPLAQRVRLNPDITGINIGKDTFKIALFADDTLLTLTHLQTSLPNLFNEITNYAKLSGLRVNNSKSEAIAISLQHHHQKLLEMNFEFKWRKDTMKYLGINLTPKHKELYNKNYPPMIQKLISLINSWEKQHISWLGRLHTLKMMIVPKILYLFRTLPIPINATDLEKLQKRMLTFLWNNKPHRINKRVIMRSTLQGGLNFPNLLNYWKAAQLAQMVKMHCSPTAVRWVALETQLLAPQSPRSILWITRNHRRQITLTNPILRHTMRLWDKLLVKHKPWISSDPSPFTPIVNNPEFPPGTDSQAFQWWTTNQYTDIGSLTPLGNLLTWDDLKQKKKQSPTENFSDTHKSNISSNQNWGGRTDKKQPLNG
uniref:Reverse transcriptase domain-containing protein n=1 Tax=Xenopus tropicalis TaxID=8364 RepID=A0A803J609_XENTR